MGLRVLDMFCGAGGSSAGAALAGAQVVAGIDAWDTASATFRDNFSGAKVQTRTLRPASTPGRSFREGEIDLLLASPECTNHSPAKGSAVRCEKSKATSHYVLNFASKLRPRRIVLENVVQIRNWTGYHPLLDGLRRRGYRLATHVVDAADFGVPQTRRRLFVLADRDREPPPPVGGSTRRRTAEEIIDTQGRYASRPLHRTGRATATLERAERAIKALGRRKPFLIVYYGSDGAGGWQTLDRPLRTITTIDRFGLVSWEGDEPMLRMLQVDELKLAMGFLASYRLDRGSRRDKIRMIGNGVCPPVMQALVGHF